MALFQKILTRLGLLIILLAVGCVPIAAQQTPPTHTPVPLPSPTPAPLTVSLRYPGAEHVVEMGQGLKFIVEVTTPGGAAVEDARVELNISDTAGQRVGSILASGGEKGIYRSEMWPIPRRTTAGAWQVSVQAAAPQQKGETSSTLSVQAAASEIVLEKYGFWLDAPTMRGIVPQIMLEQGDAHNGLIRWGGTSTSAQHIQPAVYMEIHWREGDFQLRDEAAVQQFMLAELGNLGFTPVRALGPFTTVRFKQWEAWLVKGLGLLHEQDEVEWLVFYAPEVNKTFSLGTSLVLPPAGINTPAALRDSFALYPALKADGKAPEPLPHLLAGPQPRSPQMGARFSGLAEPITLTWEPVKDLAEDEYYEVSVAYNYQEADPVLRYATRATQFTLPQELYQIPNCHVFNWHVTLMHRTGPDNQGQALSYPGLRWYLFWFYPVGEPEPYPLFCQNAAY